MIRNLVLVSCVALALALSLSPQVQARPQQAYAPLQERMSHAAFMRLGLDKLSPAQLQGLNAWLRNHGEIGPSMDAQRAGAARGPAVSSRQDARELRSHIVGPFHGWESGTVFTLANGQRWKVTGDSESMASTAPNPAVTLRKGFLGGWLMNIDGVRQTVHVTPLR